MTYISYIGRVQGGNKYEENGSIYGSINLLNRGNGSWTCLHEQAYKVS